MQVLFSLKKRWFTWNAKSYFLWKIPEKKKQQKKTTNKQRILSAAILPGALRVNLVLMCVLTFINHLLSGIDNWTDVRYMYSYKVLFNRSPTPTNWPWGKGPRNVLHDGPVEVRWSIATEKALFSSEECWYLSYFSTKTYVVGTH